MALIGLTTGQFTVIPEGTHVFKIVDAEYDAFGILLVKMQTRDGLTHTERFTLIGEDGEPNQRAVNAFSYFAHTALKDFSLTQIDHTDLIGKFIKCEVKHDTRPNKNDPTKTVTFVRLDKKEPVSGWEDTSVVAPAPAPAKTNIPMKNGAVDLDALLGG